jgi:hypothetical protein
MRVVMEDDALGLHLRDATVDQLLHLEIRNAVAQQAAGLSEFLVDMHLMAGARELLRAGLPAGPPMTATLLAGLLRATSGLIQPSSQPRSTMAHSIVLIVTGCLRGSACRRLRTAPGRRGR